jgi:hypothetical protein
MTRALLAVGLAALSCLAAALGCTGDVLLFPGVGGAGGGPSEDAGADAPPTACASSSECAAFDGQCSIGQCVSGVCTAAPSNELGPCNDGLPCTTGDVCQSGICAGLPVECPSADICLLGYCLAETGECAFTEANDGEPCDDGDPCFEGSTCIQGQCGNGGPVDCSFLDSACAIGICIDGCAPMPINQGGACDDGLFCTTGETCSGGGCAGGQVTPCADPGQCLVGACDEASDTCIAVAGDEGSLCNDLNPCTVSSTCAAGQCVGGVPGNEGQPCDDLDACTVNDACAAGSCAGTSDVSTYFTEDFSSNVQGWTLGTEWGIGPAMLSFGGVFGADPDVDHSPSNDNGVAGVVIGGNADTNLHAFYYLESPPFDTNVPGPVVFSFWRWLNSDYLPFMQNVVEVWNGATWITLWSSGEPPQIVDSPPDGPGWNQHVHDVTAFKSPAMRVRFGFDVASAGAFTIGSWNVDDVRVGSAVCD